jgi:hypothetical protein
MGIIRLTPFRRAELLAVHDRQRDEDQVKLVVRERERRGPGAAERCRRFKMAALSRRRSRRRTQQRDSRALLVVYRWWRR